MKHIFRVVLFLASCVLWANDAYVRTAGASLFPLGLEKHKNIQMLSEKIDIELLEGRYLVNVDFTFYNYGPTETITVGFPQWRHRQPTESDFSEFATTINGHPVPFETITPEDPEALGEFLVVTRWYTRKVEFPGNTATHTSVRYSAPYGVYGISESLDYLFGTGSTWKGAIGKIDLHVENDSMRWINRFWIDSQNNFSVTAEGTGFSVALENVIADIGATLTMIVDDVPSFLATMHVVDPTKKWALRDEPLIPSSLKLLNRPQLRILRNLVFAGRGHIFESEEINSWLTTYCKDWYRPLRKVGLEQLSQQERENVEAIQSEEESRT